MLIEPWFEVPIALALSVVIGILATCVIASLLRPQQHAVEAEQEPAANHPV
jgi:hypothetical protein